MTDLLFASNLHDDGIPEVFFNFAKNDRLMAPHN